MLINILSTYNSSKHQYNNHNHNNNNHKTKYHDPFGYSYGDIIDKTYHSLLTKYMNVSIVYTQNDCTIN